MSAKLTDEWGKKNKRNQSRLILVSKPVAKEIPINKDSTNVFITLYSRAKKWFNKTDITDRIIIGIIVALIAAVIIFIIRTIWSWVLKYFNC